jgi:hypothetical protein
VTPCGLVACHGRFGVTRIWASNDDDDDDDDDDDNNNNNKIPVTTGATRTISKSFRKYVSTILGNHEVKELQKTAILGTAHILRKVLM